MDMTTPSIILENVSIQQYGKTVLDSISFELSSHQHLVVTGISGSGKTTLAKTLAGQLFHKGKLEIRYTDHALLQHKVAMAGHSDSLKNLSNTSDFYYQQRFNSSDAADAVTAGEELNNTDSPLSPEEKTRAISHWLEQLHLLHRKEAPLIQLSNGEQKKLQLIKVLLQQPQVLILDKVFTGLDAGSRSQLNGIIDQQAARGTTVILITDDTQLPSCITHIAELDEGKLTRFITRETFDKEEKTRVPVTIFNNRLLPDLSTRHPFKVIVSMKDVTVRYGDKTILQNINWEVKKGERWLLKGPNGAGKSTLLSLITGDNPQAYANEIYLFDRRRGKGESIWDIKQKTGYVSPELHKYFDHTISVSQAIASGFFDTIGLYKQLTGAQQNLLNEWITYFELDAYKNRPLSFLYAGQQRWVLLARALIKNPPLLVLDEPCQGLDAGHVQQFIQLVDTICAQSDTTLIYVSHYDNEIPACITKKTELYQGRQIVRTKTQDVFAV
jgi:molybdate transport system ATP-binding protein